MLFPCFFPYGQVTREIFPYSVLIHSQVGILILKVGLSGIAKWYGFQTVRNFYRAFHAAKNAYTDYQEKADSRSLPRSYPLFLLFRKGNKTGNQATGA